MSLIDVKDLDFTYDGSYTPVFENVCFRIDTEWKLGFVGRNGRGKTTFLKLLCGRYAYSGKITSNVKFVYFPFEPKDKSRSVAEITEQVCPGVEEWKLLREFEYLMLDAHILYAPFDTLSGGEQTKVLLAGLFLTEDGFPLIDEPTNHLDAEARKTVADYLNRKRGFIVVSHDRAFLDGCVDHILSINRTDIEVQSGNFSSWLENFERKQQYERTQNEKLKRDIQRLDAASKRTAAWAHTAEKSKFGKQESGLKADRGFVGHKAAKVMKSAKVTENRMERAAAEKSKLLKNTEYAAPLKLPQLSAHKSRLVTLKDVRVFYDGSAVCAPFDLEVDSGDRVAVVGKNGCGKSSLLRLIVGEELDHTGTVSKASGLKISYVPQTFDGLCGSLSDIVRGAGIDESLFKTILVKFGFSRSDFDADTSGYSAGQKKKVMLARSLCQEAHLYVWDEPLNYIDIYSRLQIERLFTESGATVIFVEHDAAFVNAVANKTAECVSARNRTAQGV